MILNSRNKSFSDYTNKQTPLANNYFFAALAGTIWFLQFFFYGMGESKLGNGASSWILHMAFIILIANAWGIALKEWSGVSKKDARYYHRRYCHHYFIGSGCWLWKFNQVI